MVFEIHGPVGGSVRRLFAADLVTGPLVVNSGSIVNSGDTGDRTSVVDISRTQNPISVLLITSDFLEISS